MKFVSRSVVDQNQEQEIPRDGDQEAGSSSTPQEDYDPRTLFERLQEQKTMKEELFQEQTRLSNLIKRVDDEEAEYYQTLSDVQERLDLEKAQKEREELEAFRKAVEQTRQTEPTATTTAVTSSATDTTTSTKTSSASQKTGRRKSSKNTLEGLVVVKKKRTADEKDEDSNDGENDDKHQVKKAKSTTTTEPKKNTEPSEPKKTGLSSLMAAYSSDSESDDE
ncbi:N-terminal domain of NEFA-interacting nuclear protein NIP30-domain-containing protein [Phascolomyces articulosus]|uniref:N-terminal domain of NEFA-interacting nuclear protein NIP30-domain-containing protein n=1 Tax=Phascolomyces articulosus TaxID=60185 RepID=A0AAD5K5I9_9FUNG|nr:N-terminal domain of NEFA-interacting nuclear protein NIP30-domain-containing protein [Phascolomyces articulosus]